MLKKIILATIAIFALSHTFAQDVKVIKMPQLREMIDEADSLVIFNFWATWCRPCVAELPDFAAVAKEYPKDVKIVLISLDFADEVGTKVVPFLERKQLGLNCYLLNEPNYDAWMGQISDLWDGAIPASLIVNRSKNVHQFVAGQLHKEELVQFVEKYK